VLLLATKVGPWARVMRAGDRRLSGGARGRGVQRGTVQTGGGWSGARRGPRGTRTFEGVWEQDHDPRLMPATWPLGARGGQHHGTAGRRSAREGALQSARTHGTLGQPEFDRLKLKNFEQKFKITKNRNCRWEYRLQLLQRVT
jgi:hypothetical protein